MMSYISILLLLLPLSTALSSDIFIGPAGGVKCPNGYKRILDADTCKSKATSSLSRTFGSESCDVFAVRGCFVNLDSPQYIFFSTCQNTTTNARYAPVCEKVSHPQYIIGSRGTVECPTGYYLVTDQTLCRGNAGVALGRSHYQEQCSSFNANGCYVQYQANTAYIFYNTCFKTTSSSYQPVCRKFPSNVIVWSRGQTDCPSGYNLITDKETCSNTTTNSLKKPYQGSGCKHFNAVGCVTLPHYADSYYNNCVYHYTHSNDAPVCQKGVLTTQYDGVTYRVVTKHLTWEDAETNCQSLGGHLASIKSDAAGTHIINKYKDFMQLVGDSYGPWIGYRSRVGEKWGWANPSGFCFTYTKWSSEETNNANQDMCSFVSHDVNSGHQLTTNYTWLSAPCTSEAPSICELGLKTAQLCEDVDECTLGTHNCDSEAICSNNPGSFDCTCKTGWVGNGMIYEDECSTSSHNCDQNGNCANTAGSFNCTCKQGWTGNGTTCSDVDECTLGTHDCHSKAICLNNPGLFDCTCKTGWVGNGKHCEEFDPLRHTSFHLVCRHKSMQATWVIGLFRKNLPLRISLLDPRCDHYTQNKTHAWISTNFTECGTVVTQHGNQIVQHNVATVIATFNNGIIRKVRDYSYNMSCIFDRQFNIMTADSFLAKDQKVYISKRNGSSTYPASIQMYETRTYLKVHTEDPVSVGTFEPMFFGVKVDNNNDKLKFVVEQCYAVPTTGAQDMKYVFFGDKCPIDSSFKINNFSNYHFNFEVEAFNFIRAMESIRIHCLLLVCKSESEEPECTQECAKGNRKRRNVKGGLSIEAFDVATEYSIAYKEKSTCNDILCPLNSVCIELYPAICRCNQGFVIDRISGQCEELNFRVGNIRIDMVFMPSYLNDRSDDFLRLVANLENSIWTSLRVNKTITGIKVTGVKRGSVIAEVALLHAPNYTPEEAYNVFVGALKREAETPTGSLKLLPGATPTLLKDNGNPTTELLNEVSTTIIVVLSVAIVAVVAVAVVCYRRKNHRQAREEKGVSGVNNRGVELNSYS